MSTVQQNPLTWANCKQQDYDSWREKVHIVFTMNNSSNQARSTNQQMNKGQEPTTKFTTQMLYVKGSTENAEMKMKMKMQQLKHETSNKKTKYIVTPSNWCRNHQRSKTKIAFEAPLYMQSQCRMKAKPHLPNFLKITVLKNWSEVSNFESKLFIGWKSQISINQQYQLPPKHIMRKKSATSRIIGKLWRNFQQPNLGWTKDHIVINQLKAWNYWQYWRWISHNMKVSIDWSMDDMCAPSQPDLPIYSDYWQLQKWSVSQSVNHSSLIRLQ